MPPLGPSARASTLPPALENELAGHSAASLTGAVSRLMKAYQSSELPSSPLLGSDREATAYAAYRMPATHAAVGAAVRQVLGRLPDFAPASVVDVGAGTGAASWAVSEALPVNRLTLLEQSVAATDLGRRLAATSGGPLAEATWESWRLTRGTDVELPPADLLVAAYLLGELDGRLRRRLVAAAADTAGAVLLVEPGTPDGYSRIVEARRQLLAAGMSVVAPCPHQQECPLAGRQDWCHFSVRVQRSALHRRLKDGQLGHEDEKFSFVAAIRDPVGPAAAARVLRHPQVRKGLVSLQLCQDDGTADRHLISKSNELYRAARKTSWGDEWPPRP